MRVVFYVSPGKYKEEDLVKSLQRACVHSGDKFEVHPNSGGVVAGEHVACMVGMKSHALRLACLVAGNRVVTFDKGYDRREDWWRFAVDTHQPTRYLMDMNRPMDRASLNGWTRFAPWREAGEHIIIASGGLKYHHVHELPHPTVWVRNIVACLKAMGCKRQLIYRPKPSMPDPEAVEGTEFSRHKYVGDALRGAHAVITFGSNICFEAAMAGVPCIVLGDAIGAPISSPLLDDIERPVLSDIRNRWFSNLAYCQVRMSELTNGGWIEIRRQVEELPGA